MYRSGDARASFSWSVPLSTNRADLRTAWPSDGYSGRPQSLEKVRLAFAVMAVRLAHRACVALEDRASRKVLRAATVARAHVLCVDEEQLVIQQARLADSSRYGRRGLRPDGSLPATTAEELGIQLSGMRTEEVFAESVPASVAKRR